MDVYCKLLYAAVVYHFVGFRTISECFTKSWKNRHSSAERIAMNSFLFKSIRQIAFITSTNLVGIGGFMVYYLPNTSGLNKIKEITQVYRNLEPAPVSECLENMKKQVMKEINITEDVEDQIELYHLYGFQPYSFGSTWKTSLLGGRTGLNFNRAIIGIPLNYNQDSKIFSWKDIVLMEKGKGKPINWASEDGQQLQKSLTLSDKAKKFALAQQIVYVSNNEVLFKAFLTGFVCPLTLFIAKAINDKGNLLHRPQKLRFAMYSVVVMFNVTLWAFLKDVIINNMEAKSDEVVASFGKDYIEGGLEFYNKQLNTNISLRTLLGKKGEKQYTLFGNENTLFRQKHLPITHRRDFFKEKLDNFDLSASEKQKK